MSIKIGVIAENDSDVEVVKALIGKITNTKFGIYKVLAKSSGNITTKCIRWIKYLVDIKDSNIVLIVRDSDTGDYKKVNEIRSELEAKAIAAQQKRKVSIIIPVQEIEAWLLADEKAIGGTFSSIAIKPYLHPETIPNPKEEIVRQTKGTNSKSPYSNKTHNKLIAEKLDLDKVYKKCPSFAPFYDVVSSL
ncbi:MAG: DUF4276 family protein [Nitrospirae bacterium]|nr:DUF4276 family protein [Nitrospirota bacterium]